MIKIKNNNFKKGSVIEGNNNMWMCKICGEYIESDF